METLAPNPLWALVKSSVSPSAEMHGAYCRSRELMFFMIWPFFPHQQELGTLAWMGGIVALAVYFLSLRRTSGGIAFDFLQRLARRQRSMEA